MRSNNFAGSRLKLARSAAGLTQVELAEMIATSASFISEIERGLKEPGDLIVAALGEVLGFRPEFFYEPPPSVFEPDEVNFRHRASTPEYLKAHISAKATLFRLVAEQLDMVLEFPPFNVPAIPASTPAEFEEAARRCREHWGLGQDVPIQSLVRVAENAGIVVLESKEADKVDAFSAVKNGIGIIVLNTSKDSTSRARWNIAHELGHFVAHRNTVTGTKEREDEANFFARSFLLPAKAFERDFISMGLVDWPHLFELKRHWKVSVAAIVRRAYNLSLISTVDYRRLNRSMSARGWKKQEPGEPPYEQPELMNIAVSSLELHFGKSMLDISENLGWTREKTEEITGFKVPQPTPENVRSIARFRAEKESAG